MDALYQHPRVKYMLALHETVAMGMAGGYSWASGKTGFVNVHTAPGVANAISALYNANVADFNIVFDRRPAGHPGSSSGSRALPVTWSA